MTTHSIILAWDREAWQAIVHEVTKESDTTEQLSVHVRAHTHTQTFILYKTRLDLEEREWIHLNLIWCGNCSLS